MLGPGKGKKTAEKQGQDVLQVFGMFYFAILDSVFQSHKHAPTVVVSNMLILLFLVKLGPCLL